MKTNLIFLNISHNILREPKPYISVYPKNLTLFLFKMDEFEWWRWFQVSNTLRGQFVKCVLRLEITI